MKEKTKSRLQEFLKEIELTEPTRSVDYSDSDRVEDSHYYEARGIKQTLTFIESLSQKQLTQFQRIIRAYSS